jgi:elongation factor 3
MWNHPHMLILDEPTNFLDRDSLGGLAVAIKTWEGAVCMISHNREFVGALCNEEWHVDAGQVTVHSVEQDSDFDASASEPPSGIVTPNRSGASTPIPRSGASTPSGYLTPASIASALSDTDADREQKELERLAKKGRERKKLTRNQLKQIDSQVSLLKMAWTNNAANKGKGPIPPDEYFKAQVLADLQGRAS